LGSDQLICALVYFYFEFHYSEKILAGQSFANFTSINCAFSCSRYSEQGEFKEVKPSSRKVNKWLKQAEWKNKTADREKAKQVYKKTCQDVYAKGSQAQEYIKKFCAIVVEIDAKEKKNQTNLKTQSNNIGVTFLLSTTEMKFYSQPD
jgi:hypothetical protein